MAGSGPDLILAKNEPEVLETITGAVARDNTFEEHGEGTRMIMGKGCGTKRHRNGSWLLEVREMFNCTKSCSYG